MRAGAIHSAGLFRVGSATVASNTHARRRPRWPTRVALSAVTLVALDVGVGVLFCRDGQFRQWRLPPFPLLFTENQSRWLYADDWPYYRFDAQLGWTLRPAAVFGDRRYRTNAAAIRADREYEIASPPEVTRVAVFGDSFVHGDEVDNTQTAWALLEASRADSEVLNFGVPGYGTDQAYLRYVHEAAVYSPHIVVVGLMLENLQRNVSVFRPAYYPDTGLPLAKPRFQLDPAGELRLIPTPAKSLPELRDLIETGRLIHVLCQSDYWVQRSRAAYRGSPLFASSLGRILYAAHANGGRSQADYYENPASEPFQVTASVLEAFCRRAQSDGAGRVLVLILPDKNTMREQLSGSGACYWESMVKHLRSRGLECIDFSPALLTAVRRDGVDGHFAGTHYSAEGHAELARFLDPILFASSSP